jgi:hypothetical protein
MPRQVRIVILCEDTQQEVFVRYLLEEYNFNSRKIRAEKAPKGLGDAQQYVINNFPQELQKYRSRSHDKNIALITVIDADELSCQEKKHRLVSKCKQLRIEPPMDNENVFIFLAKRNTETWLKYLENPEEQLSEAEDYKRLGHREESQCRPLLSKLAEMCKADKLVGNPPDSLKNTCPDFKKFLEKVSG